MAKTKTKTETLKDTLVLRVAPSDTAALDELVERIQVSTRNGIARAAMRIGIEALAKNPALLFAKPIPKRRKRKS